MLQRWWLVRPLVCRFLLGMVGVNIPQQPVITLRPSKCYTTKAPKRYTTTYAAPMLLRRSSEVFSFPELHYPHHAAYWITTSTPYYTKVFSTTPQRLLSIKLQPTIFQLAIKILPCTILFPATTPRIVTPLKRPSTALQPTLIQLKPWREPSTTPRREPSTTPRREPSTTPRREPSTTPRREPSTTPRREPSTTPRRECHDTPILPFSSLQPTLLQNTTLMFPSTTPTRQPSIIAQTTIPQFSTRKFLITIAELSTRGCLCLSVIFTVIGRWELIVDLKLRK
jgi:hypothetical protein